MALAIGRTVDHVRVLSDLSGSVVGALIDDAEDGAEGDAFADALRRYREEGAPSFAASWRSSISTARPEGRTAAVLRHLTRDLLKGVSALEHGTAAATEVPAEAPPPNVHPIGEPHDVPALEQASDGTWKPSGSSLASQEEIDASSLRRNVPSARSRYPQIERSERIVLPAPPRFTQMTAPQVTAPPAAVPIEEPPAPIGAAASIVVPSAPIVPSAPVASPEAIPHGLLVERESVIRAVASGTEVIAGPFARFQQLAAFVKALRGLDGVQDVTTRQFVRGTVHLRVRHSHAVPLADRLLELTQFEPSVVSSAPDRIELTVDIPE